MNPDEGTRKPARMSAEEEAGLVQRLVQDASDLQTDELSAHRVKATKYYRGDPFGNEVAGRSQVVLTEVRDAVLGILPGLLEVVFGPEQVVEFVARDPLKAAVARQATDYVARAFREEMGGWIKTHAVLKDGLIRRLGAWTWGWDTRQQAIPFETVVSEEEAPLLAAEEGVRITETFLEPGGEGRLRVRGVRTSQVGGPWVDAIKPENVMITRGAADVESAAFAGWKSQVTRSYLREIGISEADIMAHAGPADAHPSTADAEARDPEGTTQDPPEAGEANQTVTFVTGYLRIDRDGDGIAEHWQVECIGEQYHPVRWTPGPKKRPIATFCPDPEAHVLVGYGISDRTEDLQYIKSGVARATLDSLAASIHPRTVVNPNVVNMLDLLNTGIGAPIRSTDVTAVQPLTVPFVGKEAFTVLAYFDEVSERRTGLNKGTMGLDADALQSTTKSAADAVISGGQSQQQLIARHFVEQALRPLFAGLYELYMRYQPMQRTARLRGQWVPVDPRTWDADAEVEVVLAMGTGSREKRLAALETIAGKQEQALQLLGPQNLLVSLVEYRNTLDEACRLLGYPDSSRFFKAVTEEQLQQAAAAAAQQPPQPSPEQVLAQAQLEAEKMKVEKELTIRGQQLQLEAMKSARELELRARELDLRERELALRQLELDMVDTRERDLKGADIEVRLTELEHKLESELERLQTQVAIADLTSERQLTGTLATSETSANVSRDNAQLSAQVTRETAALQAETARTNAEKQAEAKREAAKPRAMAAKVTRGPDGRVSGIEASEPRKKRVVRTEVERDEKQQITGLVIHEDEEGDE